MTRVGIREAKAHLSRLLKQVREGEEIVITDRGRAVGRIVPVPSQRDSLDDLVHDLELRGILERRTAPATPLPSPARVAAGRAQRLLQEDRNG